MQRQTAINRQVKFGEILVSVPYIDRYVHTFLLDVIKTQKRDSCKLNIS